MKKMYITLSILLVITGLIYMNLFHLGSVVNAERLYFSNINIDEEWVELNLIYVDSALSYSRYVTRIEDETLYIKIYYALPSKFRKVTNKIKIEIDMDEINEINVEDGMNSLNIWRR